MKKCTPLQTQPATGGVVKAQRELTHPAKDPQRWWGTHARVENDAAGAAQQRTGLRSH